MSQRLVFLVERSESLSVLRGEEQDGEEKVFGEVFFMDMEGVFIQWVESYL